MSTSDSTRQTPGPPWKITGSGYVLFYRLPKSVLERPGVVPPELEKRLARGIASIIVIDYDSTPVGPYQELAFSPGQFKFQHKKFHSVTRIYVSTPESVEAGREHWGLPKELAEFEIKREGGVEEFIVSKYGHTFFRAGFRPGRVTLPLSTFLYKPSFLQVLNDRVYASRLKGRARFSLAALSKPEISPAYLPDVASIFPIGVVNLRRFNLMVMPPRIYDTSIL